MSERAWEPSRDPSPQEQFDASVDARLAELHTAIPAVVERFFQRGDLWMVDAKPVLSRRYVIDGADGERRPETKDYPVIPDVPVSYPRGGGGYMSWPLERGDLCLLIFSERSLDRWIDSDGRTVVYPDDARKHHISDAVCIPGLATVGNPVTVHPTDLVLGTESGDVELHITPGGEVQAKCNAFRMGTTAANLALARANQANANFNLIQSKYDGHTHLYVAPGGPVPTTAPGIDDTIGTLPSVASTRAFVDA